ncbi:MAG: multiheme c-type cytochrome [Gammaproteobacteria bacterium]|nr:multiheme c-type cytochrome [Gammaproteobacteria bacterium]
MTRRLALLLITTLLFSLPALADRDENKSDERGKKDQDDETSMSCVQCHKKITPTIVTDWKLSEHSEEGVSCADCHGSKHTTKADVDEAEVPMPEVCAECHGEQYNQFAAGKHAKAWAALQAMPTTHALPSTLVDGMKGCGGCHKIGFKSEADLEALKEAGQEYGVASCDSCHTRHLFSKEEARQPQACRTCHMGFDHPQWEMYSSSKHGVRNDLKQLGILPEEAAGPTCQDCHMANGTHENRTPWGFLAVRLPLPEDEQWAADQTTILKALRVFNPVTGDPIPEMVQLVIDADVARLTQEAFDAERDKLLAVCRDCHSEKFALGEMEKGDETIKAIDRLMAEAITIVARLYEEGLLRRPDTYVYDYPNLLTFHDAPTGIEQRLFVMHLEHRMRAFQGVFHNNPDYALWYGWSEMVRDLTAIKEMAVALGLNLDE